MPLAGAADVEHDAILLHHGESMSLILEPGIFTGEAGCMIAFEKAWQAVKLERSLERGCDYERVAVSLVSEQTAT